MTGSINQVQYILFPILMLIINLNCMTLDSYALFPFQVHIIEYLVHHFPFIDSVGSLQKAVCKGGFTMIYMSYNAKIPDILQCPRFCGGKGN